MTTDNLREGGHKGPSFTRRTFAKAAGVSAAALAIGASGASLAWFTGRDTKENKLSIAQNLNIRVVEPAWDPENAKSIVPNQHIPKDPRIENLSDEFSGWMVVEIRVPTAEVSVFDEAEQKALDPARTPLFSFVADPKWTLLQQFKDGDEDVYRFGWPETIPALGQTPPIFEEVVVANLVEAQGQSGSKTITATGYGIQSEGLPDIATAWDAYKKQNGIGDGGPEKRIVSAVTAGTLLKFVEGVPEVGDEIDGKTIGEVVPDIEHLEPRDRTPLTSTPGKITYVDGTTPTTPENTVNWFKDMSKVEEMDLTGIDIGDDASNDDMFRGTSNLVKVAVCDDSPIVSKLPEGFEQTLVGGIYELQRYTGLRFKRQGSMSDRYPKLFGLRANGKEEEIKYYSSVQILKKTLDALLASKGQESSLEIEGGSGSFQYTQGTQVKGNNFLVMSLNIMKTESGWELTSTCNDGMAYPNPSYTVIATAVIEDTNITLDYSCAALTNRLTSYYMFYDEALRC